MDKPGTSALGLPFDRLCEAVEDERCRAQSKGQNLVVVVLALPLHPKEVLVLLVNITGMRT